MKILSVSCLIGALMLGLFAAWVAAAPQQTNGNQVVAGWDKCKDEGNAHCSPIDPEKSCSGVHIVCTNTSGGKDCSNINMSCFAKNCKSAWDKSCL
jgi:hypothetical protein